MFRPFKSVKQFIMPADNEVRFGYLIFSIFKIHQIFLNKTFVNQDTQGTLFSKWSLFPGILWTLPIDLPASLTTLRLFLWQQPEKSFLKCKYHHANSNRNLLWGTYASGDDGGRSSHMTPFKKDSYKTSTWFGKPTAWNLWTGRIDRLFRREEELWAWEGSF